MFYLITDQDNKSWRDVQWGENISHDEENFNYHFAVYHGPQTASYMYPCYEGIKEPKLWLAAGRGLSMNEGLRSYYSQLTTTKEFAITWPTTEQRITFGILCAMNLVMHPEFREWGKKYLKGDDQTKESAHSLNEKLLKEMGTEVTRDRQYVACCHAVFSSVLLQDPALFAANAGHRAYHDSLELTQALNLEQTAQIVNMLAPGDIAGIL